MRLKPFSHSYTGLQSLQISNVILNQIAPFDILGIYVVSKGAKSVPVANKYRIQTRPSSPIAALLSLSSFYVTDKNTEWCLNHCLVHRYCALLIDSVWKHQKQTLFKRNTTIYIQGSLCLSFLSMYRFRNKVQNMKCFISIVARITFDIKTNRFRALQRNIRCLCTKA